MSRAKLAQELQPLRSRASRGSCILQVWEALDRMLLLRIVILVTEDSLLLRM